MKPELKPCPFCGKEATITKHFKEDMHQLIHRCEVIGPIVFEWGDRDTIVKAWNTRSEEIAERAHV